MLTTHVTVYREVRFPWGEGRKRLPYKCLCLPGGGAQQCFIREVSALRSYPLPFYLVYRFLIEKAPLSNSYTFY